MAASTNIAESIPKRPAAPGFEHINRYWDKKMKVHAAKILPGELFVSSHGELVATVLGSCVAACIRDKVRGIGGMNHFMLPEDSVNSRKSSGSAHDLETRYGNWAMEKLINEILKRGGKRGYLEVKLFGGGQVLENMTDIGQRNIEFVKRFLEEEGLEVVAEDLGGTKPRKVLYFSDTGACRVRRMTQVPNTTLFKREKQYAREITMDSADGAIELFN